MSGSPIRTDPRGRLLFDAQGEVLAHRPPQQLLYPGLGVQSIPNAQWAPVHWGTLSRNPFGAPAITATTLAANFDMTADAEIEVADSSVFDPGQNVANTLGLYALVTSAADSGKKQVFEYTHVNGDVLDGVDRQQLGSLTGAVTGDAIQQARCEIIPRPLDLPDANSVRITGRVLFAAAATGIRAVRIRMLTPSASAHLNTIRYIHWEDAVSSSFYTLDQNFTLDGAGQPLHFQCDIPWDQSSSKGRAQSQTAIVEVYQTSGADLALVPGAFGTSFYCEITPQLVKFGQDYSN